MTDCRDILIELVRLRKIYEDIREESKSTYQRYIDLNAELNQAEVAYEAQQKIFDQWVKTVADEERGNDSRDAEPEPSPASYLPPPPERSLSCSLDGC